MPHLEGPYVFTENAPTCLYDPDGRKPTAQGCKDNLERTIRNLELYLRNGFLTQDEFALAKQEALQAFADCLAEVAGLAAVAGSAAAAGKCASNPGFWARLGGALRGIGAAMSDGLGLVAQGAMACPIIIIVDPSIHDLPADCQSGGCI